MNKCVIVLSFNQNNVLNSEFLEGREHLHEGVSEQLVASLALLQGWRGQGWVRDVFEDSMESWSFGPVFAEAPGLCQICVSPCSEMIRSWFFLLPFMVYMNFRRTRPWHFRFKKVSGKYRKEDGCLSGGIPSLASQSAWLLVLGAKGSSHAPCCEDTACHPGFSTPV